jgi:ArsR family transcriptional regulator
MRINAYIKPGRPTLEASLKALKALADINRLRAAILLAAAGRALCVCELVDAMGESQYNVSRYLGALCAAGVIKKEKKGRWTMYRLAKTGGPLNEFVAGLAKPGARGGRIAGDLARLKKRLVLRENGICVVGCTC